jgi:hypothetical protein
MTLAPAVRAPAVAMSSRWMGRINKGRAAFRQSRLALSARAGSESGRPAGLGGRMPRSRRGARSDPLRVLISFMKIEFVPPKRR